MDKPSVSSTFKDTGALEFNLDETDEANRKERQTCGEEDNTSSEENKQSKVGANTDYPESDVIIANISVHEPPKVIYDTYI